MGRKSGSRNRNYPPLKLAEAIRVASTIEDEASGMTVSKLTLAQLLDTTPSSSILRDLVAASRFYGLTEGGIRADEFGLSKLGQRATGGDEVARTAALKEAVLSVPPYRLFLESFANKKIPGPTALKEFLIRDAGVPEERVEECMEFILADAETAGFLTSVKGGRYIDFSGTPPAAEWGAGPSPEEYPGLAEEKPDLPSPATGTEDPPEKPSAGGSKPKKVFIAHGKNRIPLEQLKKALDQFKVSYAVAVDEPHKGRPISRKVANLMRDDCSSGIFIFTADEHFLRPIDSGTEEVGRPSENVVFELGAASMLYDNRIVIFKEKGVSFPSDFSDLGYIEFERDQLVAELGKLFSELVSLDILEVRAKS